MVYAVTLAPGVTFWDAGEFIAASHALGIPHPPGTPLFVMMLHVWAAAWSPVLSYAVATNLFSAACTAAAAGLAAWLIARGRTTMPAAAGVAAALCAGAMSTIWLNATETEVYAAALLLAMLTLAAGERAGREPGFRWLALTAYLVALAVPLHLSALVATPAAIVLAADRPDGVDHERGMLLAGAWVLTIGAGRASVPLSAIGLMAVVASAFVMAGRVGRRRSAAAAGATIGAVAVALSAVAFMLLRARLDPFINQGNPATWRALVDAIARHQYDVAPLWPRQAPVWLQLANVGQYADWQTGLGLGPGVMPSAARTAATVVFLALGAYGAAWHRRDDARTWRALVALLACGSLGVAAYLNLKAGPSIGAGVLPATALHEARERDYFFTLAFWAWGLWAGYGAVALARRLRQPAWAGVLLAAAPIACNWRAVSRRSEPEARLPAVWARALLDATPPHGVLLVAGDNDTYPLWYEQEVEQYRPDVRVVTLPLTPAGWYRAELQRRGDLLPAGSAASPGDDPATTGAVVARRAVAAGRPVAVSAYVDRATRDVIGRNWRANGLVFVLDSTAPAGAAVYDTAAAHRLAAEAVPVAQPIRESTDPVDAFFQSLLGCPAYVLRRASGTTEASLDSLCNFR